MSNPDLLTINKSIQINATRDKIWQSLIEKSNFEDWCSVFYPGTTFEGDWSVGSNMRFLGPDVDSDTQSGMITRIAEHIPNEYLLGEHIGVVEAGKDRFEGEDFDRWAGGTESYRITGDSQPYTLSVEASSTPEMAEFFEGAWDTALSRLKQIAES